MCDHARRRQIGAARRHSTWRAKRDTEHKKHPSQQKRTKNIHAWLGTIIQLHSDARATGEPRGDLLRGRLRGRQSRDTAVRRGQGEHGAHTGGARGGGLSDGAESKGRLQDLPPPPTPARQSETRRIIQQQGFAASLQSAAMSAGRVCCSVLLPERIVGESTTIKKQYRSLFQNYEKLT